MSASDIEAAIALSEVSERAFEAALTNLKLSKRRKSWFSDPRKSLLSFDVDAVTAAQLIDQSTGTQFLALATYNHPHVEFWIHNHFAWMTSDLISANEIIAALKPSGQDHLMHVLSRLCQDIAIRSKFIETFCDMSLDYISKNDGAIPNRQSMTLPENAERTAHFMSTMAKGLEQLKGHWSDPKAAAELLKSCPMPLIPLLVSYQIEPDARIVSGAWMTADMARQREEFLSKMQASAFASGK